MLTREGLVNFAHDHLMLAISYPDKAAHHLSIAAECRAQVEAGMYHREVEPLKTARKDPRPALDDSVFIAAPGFTLIRGSFLVDASLWRRDSDGQLRWIPGMDFMRFGLNDRVFEECGTEQEPLG